MNRKVEEFKKDLLNGNEITLTDEELLENLEEFLDATIDAIKTVDKEIDDLATGLDEVLKMERDFKHFEEEPNTIDHVMDLRAKFFKPRPRGESDARIDELLANAPEPSITEEQVRNRTWYEETPEDNDDNFWSNFFDGIDDEEDRTRSNRMDPNPPADRNGIADPMEIDGLPDATIPAVNAADSIGATDIDSPVDHRDSTYTIRGGEDFGPQLESTHIGPTSSAQPNDGAIPVRNIATPADGTNPIDSISRENPVDDNTVTGPVHRTGIVDPIEDNVPVDRTGIVDPNGIVDPIGDNVLVDRTGIADHSNPTDTISRTNPVARNNARRSEILALPPATSQYAETPPQFRPNIPGLTPPARQQTPERTPGRTPERNPVERGAIDPHNLLQVPQVQYGRRSFREANGIDGFDGFDGFNGTDPNADGTSADQNEEFDMTREVHRLLRDVINELPFSQIFVRNSVVRSSQAFMVFCNLWCLGVFAVGIDQRDGSYVIRIA